MSDRSGVLAAFAMEEHLTPDLLKQYLTRHPALADDLLDLFNDLVLSDLEAEATLERVETKAVNAETARIAQAEAALFAGGVRELAKRLGLPRSFLAGLHSSFVRSGSIPVSLVKGLARAIGVYTTDVMAALRRSGAQAYSFKSDEKPGFQEAIAFDDYLAQAALKPEELAALEQLMRQDGPD